MSEGCMEPRQGRRVHLLNSRLHDKHKNVSQRLCADLCSGKARSVLCPHICDPALQLIQRHRPRQDLAA